MPTASCPRAGLLRHSTRAVCVQGAAAVRAVPGAGLFPCQASSRAGGNFGGSLAVGCLEALLAPKFESPLGTNRSFGESHKASETHETPHNCGVFCVCTSRGGGHQGASTTHCAGLVATRERTGMRCAWVLGRAAALCCHHAVAPADKIGVRVHFPTPEKCTLTPVFDCSPKSVSVNHWVKSTFRIVTDGPRDASLKLTK